MHKTPDNMRNLLLSILIAAGAAWMIASARYALNAGWDSDVMRQWTSSQYLLEHVNPWRLSYETLYLNYGTSHGPTRFRLKDLVIYEVHPNLQTDGVEGIRSDLGPPTATYPPSALLPIALTVGFVPSHTVLPAWLIVNAAAFLLLLRLLGSRRDPIAALAIILLWPPVHEVVRTSQFVFLVMVFLILSIQTMAKRPYLSGVLLALALIKPSLTLPFLFVPLVKRRWIPFLVAGTLHLAATLVVSLWLGDPPWVLLKQWTEIPRYMLQGAYTIQELINRAGLDNAPLGQAITLGFVGACGLWCHLHRRAPVAALVAFCTFFSLLWTYHERYDYTLALIPIAAIYLQPGAVAPRWLAVAYLLLGIALTDAVYGTDHAVFQMLRWAGRLSLAGLFIYYACNLRREDTAAKT